MHFFLCYDSYGSSLKTVIDIPYLYIWVVICCLKIRLYFLLISNDNAVVDRFH